MLYVVANGLWGVREESTSAIAERWLTTLNGLKGIDGPTFDGWHEAEDGVASDPVLEPSVDTLTAYIERKNVAPDIGVIGMTSSLWAQNPGTPRVTVAVHAGGTSQWVTNSLAVTFRAREVKESAEVIRRTPEMLRVIAEAWDIDAGQVYNKSEFRAVSDEFDLENSHPRCGRAVYLSAGRAASAPEGLDGTYTRTADGGLVIDLTRGGTTVPSVEAIVEADRELRAAGALEPIPEPYDRDKF
ncbi:Imm52 family immunity protein [Streptomyces sp. NPDC056708]|uniref:Imm52 family immunity protein n=1 Tax=unclassified Streptomyces TaxID=2593676 RepID=UPI0036A835D4